MTAAELVRHCRSEAHYQLWINAFIDELRGASDKAERIRTPPQSHDEFAALVAGVVDTLCREGGIDVPDWVKRTRSPRPFFAYPARGYALRLRLMLESPPAFRSRNVFVPENYLSRA